MLPAQHQHTDRYTILAPRNSTRVRCQPTTACSSEPSSTLSLLSPLRHLEPALAACVSTEHKSSTLPTTTPPCCLNTPRKPSPRTLLCEMRANESVSQRKRHSSASTLALFRLCLPPSLPLCPFASRIPSLPACPAAPSLSSQIGLRLLNFSHNSTSSALLCSALLCSLAPIRIFSHLPPLKSLSCLENQSRESHSLR